MPIAPPTVAVPLPAFSDKFSRPCATIGPAIVIAPALVPPALTMRILPPPLRLGAVLVASRTSLVPLRAAPPDPPWIAMLPPIPMVVPPDTGAVSVAKLVTPVRPPRAPRTPYLPRDRQLA